MARKTSLDVRITELKAKIHSLEQLQFETLSLIRKVRSQLQHSPHEAGMNDTEFCEKVLLPLETKIKQDRDIAQMIRERERGELLG